MESEQVWDRVERGFGEEIAHGIGGEFPDGKQEVADEGGVGEIAGHGFEPDFGPGSFGLAGEGDLHRVKCCYGVVEVVEGFQSLFYHVVRSILQKGVVVEKLLGI